MTFSKTKRRAISLISAFLSLIVFASCMLASCDEDEITRWLNDLFDSDLYDSYGDTLSGFAVFKMHVINVGQGDSILIQCNNSNVLIDCGENGEGNRVLEYLMVNHVTHIDWLIGTHPHSDHIGGMDTVLKDKSITIDHMMMPQTSKELTPTTKTYTEVLDAAKKRKLKITRPVPGDEYYLDGMTMLVLSPAKGAVYDNLNDYSIVLKFTYKDVSILTGGDASINVERQLIALDYDLSADIYKVSHHGGKDANSQAYLDEISPRFAAISVGDGNMYGHPKDIVLSRLNNMNCQIARTDIDGNIIYKSDGRNIAVSTPD